MAVEDVFGRHGLVQRCQWRKRRNVLKYLPKGRQAYFRKELQRACEETACEGAMERLRKVKRELSITNKSAVGSLDGGLEETLTELHRLGLTRELGRSLETRNTIIESVMSLIGQATGKVDFWNNSGQKQGWLATALLDMEPSLNRICGYRHSPRLREALQKGVQIKKEVWQPDENRGRCGISTGKGFDPRTQRKISIVFPACFRYNIGLLSSISLVVLRHLGPGKEDLLIEPEEGKAGSSRQVIHHKPV